MDPFRFRLAAALEGVAYALRSAPAATVAEASFVRLAAAAEAVTRVSDALTPFVDLLEDSEENEAGDDEEGKEEEDGKT